MDCKKCEDTGKVGKDAYCDCRHGEMQNRIDRAERKAQRQREKEERDREAARKRQEKQLEMFDQYKKDNPKEDIDNSSIDHMFKLYDWVRVEGGCYKKPFHAVIIEILPRYKKIIVEARRFEDGSKATGQTTIAYSEVELLPIDVRKQDLQAMIDFAIDTKDHEWLKELSERIAAC